MAVEIVEVVDSLKKEIVCYTCCTRLRYAPIDVHTKTVTDYTGDTEIVKFLECPSCTFPIYL